MTEKEEELWCKALHEKNRRINQLAVHSRIKFLKRLKSTPVPPELMLEVKELYSATKNEYDKKRGKPNGR